MPNHKSAIKRVRQNNTRRVRNVTIVSSMRTDIKKARDVIASGDKDAAEKAVRTAVGALNSAASKGVIHKNCAARRVSRLALLQNKSAS
ncbi:SSU ribosomal protein S20p [hydrothermal vent metagenome]|uniref:SSU ribosomal protein S20p n=1 Tax=hydrothermal vent metagenome TaxID=652676 RepID=A0A3B1BW90_9ZZZZ